MKVDWNASATDKLYVRYSRQAFEQAPLATVMPLSFTSAANNPFWGMSANWNRIFGIGMVNDLLVGFNDSSSISDPIDLLGLGKLNNQLGIAGDQAVRGLTNIRWGNDLTEIGSAETGTNNANTVYQINERLTWLLGRHTLKFGGSWNYYQSDSDYPGNNGRNGFIAYNKFNFTGAPFADFLLDQVSHKGRGSATDAWTHLQHRTSLYAADDFKITDTLTLNLGLRWAYTSPFVEKDDRQANFDLTNGQIQLAGQNGNSRALYEPFYNGWEPRLGLAYRMGERWVFRGGYGIAQYMEGTGANQRLPLNPPFFFESEVRYDSTSGPGTIATGFVGLQALDAISGQLRAWDPEIRPQFTQQWNVFAEYLIGPRSSINVGYVGNKSTQLVTPIDANQPLPGTGDPATWLPTQQRRPLYPFNPLITSISTTISRGQSDYNALQTTFKQRLWQGLDFIANYTLGRAMSNNSGYFGNAGVAGEGAYPMNSHDIEANYGPAAYDARHVFSMAGSYEMPFGSGRQIGSDWNRALDAVAGGWSVSFAVTAHTGFPITVIDSANPSLQASRSPERPNRIGDGAVENPTLERWIDRAAFVSAPRGQFGNAGVGILRAPGYQNVDLSVSKRFVTFGSAVPDVPRRDVQRVQPSELRPAAGQHPEHGLRHDHEHRQRCAHRPAGGEVLLLKFQPEPREGLMDRREFLAAMAAVPALGAPDTRPIPNYRVVTQFKPAAQPGMPGPYPGRVVTVHSPRLHRRGDREGRRAHGEGDDRARDDDADRRQGSARQLGALLQRAGFRRHQDQLFRRARRHVDARSRDGDREQPDRRRREAHQHRDSRARGRPDPAARYDQFVPAGIRVESANTWLGFDPDVYVEANFFGEDDTRSYLIRMVTEQFTKIVNVPNMKDHGASGVTGCLKNIAYGEFSNVARSHYKAQTETLTFIGTLANVEPLRSRTVLHIMDGLRGVWHAGPFSRDKRYRFYPKQMKFGTDPVAIDRFLIDVIDNKRKQEGAISVWERDMKYFSTTAGGLAGRSQREPLHPRAGPHRIRRRRLASASTTRTRSSTRKSRYEREQGSAFDHRTAEPRNPEPRNRRNLAWCERSLGVVCVAALTAVALGAPPEATRFYVTDTASSLVQAGLAAAAPTGAEAAAFQEVPAPGVRMVANDAQSTTAPWIDSNGWRFQRGLQKAHYAKLPAGSAPLAAAEAFTFNVDAILNPDPGGRRGTRTHAAFPEGPGPAAAAGPGQHRRRRRWIAVMGEVLNLLTRRNLLYRVVAAPDRALDLTVQLGTADFPKQSAENPSDFAARVRAKLGDDKRLVRLYGTSTVIARLTGDGKRARLYLLSYGGRRGGGGGDRGARGGPQAQGIRVRVLGRYQPTRVAAFGAPPDAALIDVENPGNTTEFSVPSFNTVAIIDLSAAR